MGTVYRVLLICLPVLFFITVGVFIYRFIKQQQAADRHVEVKYTEHEIVNA